MKLSFTLLLALSAASAIAQAEPPTAQYAVLKAYPQFVTHDAYALTGSKLGLAPTEGYLLAKGGGKKGPKHPKGPKSA